jgi:hypothetical protein
MMMAVNRKDSYLPIAMLMSTLVTAQSGAPQMRSPHEDVSSVEHPDCTYFSTQRDKSLPVGTRSRLTTRVVGMLGTEPSSTRHASGLTPIGGNSSNAGQTDQMGTIDKYIFQGLAQAGVAPAPPTTDYEFIRRVTLDLTGRIPTVAAVNAFVTDTTPTKRAVLIDQLLASPQWVDKWTMYFGDMYQNVDQTTQTRRYVEGRNAFYIWIKSNLAANTPYNQMAAALIGHNSAASTLAESTFTKGELNWMIGGYVTGAGIPAQDTYDQQAANIADTFLGITHQNCLLCHSGAGHLTSLSLWGGQQTRYQGWQFASFIARTNTTSSAALAQPDTDRPWLLSDTGAKDYQLNTTTGNRPARQPSATPDGTDTTVAPVYNYTNPPQKPNPGEDYRAALARFITNDFQFARATVNYIWADMFSMGIVDPPDTFDPDRLDPFNPPPAPWTLQPSNPMLLNALATDFINSGYDLKALMREIANSRTYQLSSRYNGTWNDAWEPLFARKLVRRLTAEEIHDAISQSSNVFTSYVASTTVNGTVISVGPGGIGDTTPFLYAMQYPDTAETGSGADVGFLDDFLRGNRKDILRSGDSSSTQALDLMNSSVVMTRVRATGTGATGTLLAQNIALPANTMVNNLFMAVLSRPPTTAEMTLALANLANFKADGTTQAMEATNLLWTLYNKVDFIFNY